MARWSPLKRERPGWLWLVALATLLYLVVELAFNSRLLDVVGGAPSAQDIDAIEHWGRFISGFALALAFWPLLLSWGGRRAWYVGPLALVLVSSALVALAYYGEKKLVDQIVARSSPETRYVAVNLVVLQRALLAGDIELEGLELTPWELSGPDAKAFLATFPLLAYSTDNLEQKLKAHKPAVLRNMIDRRLGGLKVNADRYNESLALLFDSYRRYHDGSRQYQQALDSIPQRQEEAWQRYVTELRRDGHVSPEEVPPERQVELVYRIRQEGLQLPEDWQATDRETFNRAVASKVRADADRYFRAELPKGTELKPGLAFDAFLADPAIQGRWREGLRYPAGVQLRVFESGEEFEREAYRAAVELLLKQQLHRYDAPARDFRDRERLGEFGQRGMRALVVPPLALAFSLLGAVVHAFKLVLYLLQWLTGYGFRNGWLKASAILAGAVAMFAVFNTNLSSGVTSKPLYDAYLHQQTAKLGGDAPSLHGQALAYTIRGTIHGQKHFYPLFEWARRRLLGGFEFGVSLGSESEGALVEGER